MGRKGGPTLSGPAAGPAPGFLREGGVQVYCADPTAFSRHAETFGETLSAEERGRLERFRFRKEREEYAVTRGLLRVILAGFAGMEPRDLPFGSGPWGKPAIAEGSNPGDIRFSMSRSDRLALYAVARAREVGIDVEKVRADFPFVEVADRFFSPREAARVRSASGSEREAVFFGYWTLKEAFLKGTGEGFSLPPDRVEILLDPPRVLGVGGDAEAASRWSVRSLRFRSGHVGALAVEGRGSGPPVRLRELSPRDIRMPGMRCAFPAERVY